MELLKHVAKHHTQEQDQELKSQGEGKTLNEAEKEDVKKDKHNHKESVEETGLNDTEYENVENNNGCALPGSMLNDVLLEGY